MYIEYYINSIDEKEIDIKNTVDQIIKYPVSGILATYNEAKFIKKNFPNLRIGSFIDYPIASNDIDRRQDLILDAIKAEVNYIAISVPFYLIVNRKYNRFREDITKNLELSQKHNINIRYILEYRKFDHQLLIKICEILLEKGIDTIYPSTGLFLDNLEDNIIACAYLHEKTKINTIVNGNIWKQNQIENILKIKPFGISICHMENLKLLSSELFGVK
jgi:deoxyribose-phosphate aldolase